MANTGLKSSVKLETSGGVTRLLDSATGRSLALSDTEAMLLELWDGSPDASSLVQAAADAHLNIEPHQVAVFFTRLSKAGFISSSPPRSTEELVAVPPLGPGDTVPAFRADLTVTPAPDGRGASQVRDGQTNRAFTLFDFELSIARMLDGKRTAAQLVDNAAAIGIPVSMESLRTFIGQLKAYRFLLDGSGAVGGSDSGTWPRRRAWDGRTRELFQKALKVSRESHARDALPVLEELLAHDPGAAEARALKDRLAAQAQVDVIEVDFEELHGEELPPSGAFTIPPTDAAAPHGAEAAGDEVRHTLHAFDLELVPVPSAPKPAAPVGPAVSVPIPQEVVEQALDRYHTRRMVLVFAGVLLVVAVGALLRPVPWNGRVMATLRPVEAGRPLAPRDGQVAVVDARHGAEVKAGDVLAHLDRAALDAQAAALEGEVAAAKQKVTQLEAEPCDPKVRAREEARFAPHDAALKAALRDVEAARALTDEARRERTLKALEPLVAARQAAWDKAHAVLEEYTQDQALAQARQELEQKVTLLEEARKAAQASVITAPVAGLFLAPANAVGLQVVQGGPFGRVVSTTARVEAQGPFPRLAPLPGAKLVLEVVKLQLKDEGWTEGSAGRALQGTVDIHDGLLFEKELPLDLSYGERPFYQELVDPR